MNLETIFSTQGMAKDPSEEGLVPLVWKLGKEKKERKITLE